MWMRLRNREMTKYEAQLFCEDPSNLLKTSISSAALKAFEVAIFNQGDGCARGPGDVDLG